MADGERASAGSGRPAAVLSRRELLGGALGASAAGCVALRPSQVTVDERPLLPALEHAYVVLDAAQWQSLRAQHRLEQLGAVDAGLPSFAAPAANTHVVYVRGEHTYLELMGPENPFGAPAGSTGLGLVVDDDRALDALAHRASSTLRVETLRREVTWDVPTPRPWQRTIWFPALEGLAVSAWVSAYEPGFLPWLAPGRSGTRAADFLALRHDPQLPFVDLSSVLIGASASARSSLAAVFDGLHLPRIGDTAWSDGSARIELSAESADTRLGLRLRRPVAAWEESGCALELQAPGAVLSFASPGTG